MPCKNYTNRVTTTSKYHIIQNLVFILALVKHMPKNRNTLVDFLWTKKIVVIATSVTASAVEKRICAREI